MSEVPILAAAGVSAIATTAVAVISDAVLVAIVGGAVTTIASIIGMVVSIINHRKIEEVRHNTNSMKDALIVAAKAEGVVTGHASGVTDQKAVESDGLLKQAVAKADGHAAGVAEEKSAAMKPKP